MIKVSVIVPVYNGEKWLNRCLRSLINQTLKDIQIICVNDFSTDNSLAILQRYAKDDKRIVIRNLKRNYGESIARNKGLKMAKGKYIAFVDQDDYVDLNFYEKLYEQTRNGNVDIVKGNVKIKYNGMETISELNSKIIKNKFYFSRCWWSAIYRNSFLRSNNILLKEDIILGGDLIFLVKAVVNSNKIITVDYVFYHYIRRVNSGDSKILNYKKINSTFKTFFYIFNYLNKNKIYKDNYIIMYKCYFLILLTFFNRSKAKRNKEFVCERVIKLYKMCKHKHFLEETLNDELLYCLNNNDTVRLFALLTQIPDCSYPKVKLNPQRKYIYIWGKGEDSENVIWQCKNNDWNVTGFLDSSKKAGTILPMKILKRKIRNYFIIISSRKYCAEITQICEQAGLRESEDFWRPII